MLFLTLLAVIPASLVYVGTKDTSKQLRGVASYTDTYSGSVGYYVSASAASKATTTITNSSGASRHYYGGVYRYNYNTRKYDTSSAYGITLSNGGARSYQISRDANSRVYDYYHTVSGYATSSSSSIKLDIYKFTAKQYY